jgi:hypothetical protein
VFRYIGIAGILGEVCWRMYRYTGLTLLIYYARIGEAGLPDLGSLVRHIGQDMANGYIRDIEVNQGVISLQSSKETSKYGGRL